jgi:hypothetical protein
MVATAVVGAMVAAVAAAAKDAAMVEAQAATTLGTTHVPSARYAAKWAMLHSAVVAASTMPSRVRSTP